MTTEAEVVNRCVVDALDCLDEALVMLPARPDTYDTRCAIWNAMEELHAAGFGLQALNQLEG